jgi:hypothetical protein
MELYSLLDIVQDNILGPIHVFRSDFANVIQEGLKKNVKQSLALLAKRRIK